MSTQKHGIRGVATSALIGVAIVAALIAAAFAVGAIELPGQDQASPQSEQAPSQPDGTHTVVDSLG